MWRGSISRARRGTTRGRPGRGWPGGRPAPGTVWENWSRPTGRGRPTRRCWEVSPRRSLPSALPRWT
nr:MAG TPA: hypothetical protein [Caudoviricetes sp.]